MSHTGELDESLLGGEPRLSAARYRVAARRAAIAYEAAICAGASCEGAHSAEQHAFARAAAAWDADHPKAAC